MSMSVAFVDGDSWKDSKAKKLLTLEIIKETVSSKTKPQEVHQSNSEYLKWPLEQFQNNLYNLLRTHKQGKLQGASGSATVKSILKNGDNDINSAAQSLGLLSFWRWPRRQR